MLEPGDPGEDQLLGPARQAPQVAQPPGLGRGPEVVERRDPELRVDQANGLRSEARQSEEVEQRRRELGEQPLVVRDDARRGGLGDLVRDRLADAGDLRRAPVAVRLGDVDRLSADRVGGAVVGHGLEDELTLDLEEIADLVEDPGELAIRHRRRVVGHPASPR